MDVNVNTVSLIIQIDGWKVMWKRNTFLLLQGQDFTELTFADWDQGDEYESKQKWAIWTAKLTWQSPDRWISSLVSDLNSRLLKSDTTDPH